MKAGMNTNSEINFQTGQLRGIQLPAPRFNTGPISSALFNVEGYKHLQTFFPTLTKLFRLGKWTSGNEIWMDTPWRINAIDCSGTTGPCSVTVRSNSDSSGELLTKDVFLKATHLLDPIYWIRGAYALPKEGCLPWHHKGWLRAWQKLQDPDNQAYVEAVCSYAVGRISQSGLSPHFNCFYGAFCARADTYRYNLTEDFQSYRHERWFWKGYHRELFKFKVVNNLNHEMKVPDDVIEDILQEYIDSDSGSGSEYNSKSETLDEIDVGSIKSIGSLHSADSMCDVSFVNRGESSSSGSSHSGTTTSELEDVYTIYAEIPNYPVMLILTEKNEGTMDSLFENPSLIGCVPGTSEWENRWSAWTFQIIAALSCLQTLIGFTHNDLHTNNIVWNTTTDEYILYKTRSGTGYRIPTFGKLFKIIDFGRSIFTINRKQFISDDFKNENHAEGQYVFSPLVKRFDKEIPPNPSFDLCRLAVSMIDGVFPKKPTKKGDVILSEEDGLTVYETESPLYNLLWSWMIDDDGRNIFINPDGSERFPDFDLYKHIAEFVHKAIPSQQLGHEVFINFQDDSVEKGYSLFC